MINFCTHPDGFGRPTEGWHVWVRSGSDYRWIGVFSSEEMALGFLRSMELRRAELLPADLVGPLARYIQVSLKGSQWLDLTARERAALQFSETLNALVDWATFHTTT